MKITLELCKCGGTRIVGDDCSLDSPDAYWVCCWPTRTCESEGCENPVLSVGEKPKHCTRVCGRRDRWRQEKITREVWAPTEEWLKMREIAWENSEGVCCLCGIEMFRGWKRGKKLQFTIEHIIPLSRGGTDTSENLSGSHWVCNESKRGALVSELPLGWKKKQIEQVSTLLGRSPSVHPQPAT